VQAARIERIARISDRQRQVIAALHRLIWTEAEGDEDAPAPDVLGIPLEILVARLSADMGLTGEAADFEPEP
jgi:hypothetical protein